MTQPAVLITGAAKRIGAAMARRFAQEGWHVVIHYGTSAAEAEALAADMPSAETFGCDLRDETAAVAMVESLAERLEDWRVLVNSASIFIPDDATFLDPDTSRRAMQINARTPAMMAQAFLRHARASGGRRGIHLTDLQN